MQGRRNIGRFAAIVGTGVVALGLVIFATVKLTSSPGSANGAVATWETASAILEAAATRRDQEEWAEALAIYREGVETFPKDQAIRLAYAEALLGESDLEGAFEEFEAASAIGSLDAETHFTAGNVAAMVDRHEVAAVHFAEAQRLDGKDARYPLYLGMMQRQLKQDDEAFASFSFARTLDPNLAEAHAMIADIMLGQNKPKIALQQVRTARRLEPENLEWRLIEARAYKRDNMPKDALDVLIGVDPAERATLPVLTLMEECYGMLRRPDHAAALWAEASSLKPDDPELAFRAALAFERANALDEARRFAAVAARLGHSDAPDLVQRLGEG
ncbi:MAG: hypothetical protein KDA28_13925 [Phycisphaerales bacterium]|nr:hypothetical protein [Phycisphaerales bacterium]